MAFVKGLTAIRQTRKCVACSEGHCEDCEYLDALRNIDSGYDLDDLRNADIPRPTCECFLIDEEDRHEGGCFPYRVP